MIAPNRCARSNLGKISTIHFRENGQFLELGYFAFYTEHFVPEEMVRSLDVLCMLYGNYIVKRLVAGHFGRMNKLVPKAYQIAAADDLPGTKICNLLDCLHSVSGFNYGLFCTVDNDSIVPEYLSTNKGCTFLKKNIPWKVAPSFIEMLSNNEKGKWYRLSEMPEKIIKFLLYKDTRSYDAFDIKCFPVIIDGETVGMWMFVYSDNNLVSDSSLNSILEGTFPLLANSYRFLFQRRFDSMIVNPIFKNRDTRINKDSVFVIMPFSLEWSNDVWEQVIKPAVKEMGMIPVRADDLYGQSIMEDVWQSILKSAIIICDTTGRNPNVFYELGIAHTLGKKVLLLTQDIDDIPFDLQAYRHIEYKVTLSGGNHLKETIKRHIEETLAGK